ncbi:MAG: OmpA family protein [Silanimonas sp.]
MSTFDSDVDRQMGFVRQFFMAGATPTPIEGQGWRERFVLDGRDGRTYSGLEFHRNYEQAIAALGGQKISTAQYTREIAEAAGGRDLIEKDSASAAAVPDYEHHSYLIRQAGKEYWINVSTGSFPLHGYIAIVERGELKPSVGFLDAAAMKKALDADGRVALYINFDVDKATLRPDAQPVIAEVVSLLQTDPALKLAIEGHTDSTGSPERNRELSAQRARSVLGALVGGGIDPSRLSSAGFGPDRPLADNGSEDGRAKNRRVELVRQP